MELHLNYDNNNKNGVIFNDKYPWGAMFIGEQFKPKLSIDYNWFIFSEIYNRFEINTNENGSEITRIIDPSSSIYIEIQQMALNWVQPLGQEGNPTRSQQIQIEIGQNKGLLSSTDWYVTRKYERGVDIPEDVTSQRQSAIQSINSLEIELAGI
jgi:hypothetical protein